MGKVTLVLIIQLRGLPLVRPLNVSIGRLAVANEAALCGAVPGFRGTTLILKARTSTRKKARYHTVNLTAGCDCPAFAIDMTRVSEFYIG